MQNVLVIEDNPVMLSSIVYILNKDGYNVLTAKDGREAFEMIDNATYDVVITDLLLPYANGLEVVNKIRKNSANMNVGTMVISSAGNEEMISQAFQLGADDFLQKPISSDQLLSRIKKMVANIS